MPFYEYQCSACGAQVEVLQKIADPPLKKCPECGRSKLAKLVSAPVFRLKGGGWYETDFKTDKDARRNLVDSDKGDSGGDAKADSKADSKPDTKADSGSDAKGAAKADGKGKGEASAGSTSGARPESRPAKPAARPVRSSSSRAKKAAPRKAKR